MTRLLSRYALCMSAAAALLAGCDGSGQSGPLGATPPSAALNYPVSTIHQSSRQFWMASDSALHGRNKLLYATDGCGGTCVLSYPGGSLVGTLSVGHFLGSGACTNGAGDVFISNNNSIVEYAHGGTSPIATLNLPGTEAKGCAIDPGTGNLAVVFEGSDADVAVFVAASGQPVLYGSGLNSVACGYDASGNLFVDGYSGQEAGLAELPTGGSQFESLQIANTVELPPGQVQWDGKHMTYESASKHPIVYRLRIAGTIAKVVGETHFKGIRSFAYLSWIYGDKIFIPYSEHGTDAQKIGVWEYPKGEDAILKFQHFGTGSVRLQAVALSVVGN